MKTIQLGKSGLRVSEIGFGGIPIIPLQHDTAVDIVRHCYKRGITFFDTANMYGNSEKMIGAALEKVRDKVILATKTTKRDKEGAAKHIELSLQNFKTDHIDLYQFHNVSKSEELEKILAPDGAMAAVQEAMQSGKIKQIGITSHKLEAAIQACRTGLFATVQFPFNFIEIDPLKELFAVARELNMGIIAMKPLGGGLLNNASLCFKFLQQHPYAVPIPGISKIAEIDEILSLYENPQPLTAEEQAQIEAKRAELGQKFCHRCGYCQPCEQGVAITEVLMFRSMLERLSPAVAVMFSKSSIDTVEKCTSCGECVERCPYDLEIPELLQEVKGIFEAVSK